MSFREDPKVSMTMSKHQISEGKQALSKIYGLLDIYEFSGLKKMTRIGVSDSHEMLLEVHFLIMTCTWEKS